MKLTFDSTDKMFVFVRDELQTTFYLLTVLLTAASSQRVQTGKVNEKINLQSLQLGQVMWLCLLSFF